MWRKPWEGQRKPVELVEETVLRDCYKVIKPPSIVLCS